MTQPNLTPYTKVNMQPTNTSTHQLIEIVRLSDRHHTTRFFKWEHLEIWKQVFLKRRCCLQPVRFESPLTNEMKEINYE